MLACSRISNVIYALIVLCNIVGKYL